MKIRHFSLAASLVLAITFTLSCDSKEAITMPSQNYIGLWHTDDNPPNDLTIVEIGNTIKFDLGIIRVVGASGTAKIENNKIVFVTDANFSGTMKFNENSILLTVDKSEFEYIKAGSTYNFTLKAKTITEDITEDERIEADLVEAYENIRSDNNTFNEKILNYTSNYPSTLTCKFDTLKNMIDIASSEDGLFRIYSWDTKQGGSMRDLENVFQFKSGDKVYVETTKFEDSEEGSFDGSRYTQIFTVKADSKTYYLAIKMFIGSGKVAAQAISVFTIENNSLNGRVKLFKTKTKLLDAISVDFDPSRTNRDLIKYDPAEKKVYIPIVLEDKDGELTVSDRYIIYQFKGQYFEHILTQKK